jgi:hypothetical protein
MSRPPLLMHVKVRGENANFGFWLPLFLLVPLALVALIILSPLILISILVLWALGWGKPAVLFIPAVWRVFCSMRGLEVDVQNGSQHVYVSVV